MSSAGMRALLCVAAASFLSESMAFAPSMTPRLAGRLSLRGASTVGASPLFAPSLQLPGSSKV